MKYTVVKFGNYYAVVEAATGRRMQDWFKLKRKADSRCKEMNAAAKWNKNRFG